MTPVQERAEARRRTPSGRRSTFGRIVPSERNDDVALDVTQTLAQIDVRSGERRMLVSGEPPLDDDGEGIARVMTLAPGVDLRGLEPAAQPDSTASLRVPALDIDDDALYPVSVKVLIGPRPVMIVSGDQPLPRTVVAAVAHRWGRTLTEDVEDGETPRDTAQSVKNTALSVLRNRIFAIEQSVRDALADEEIGTRDYAALRDYPARLATVERLAAAVLDPEPSWMSLHPPKLGPFGVAMPEVDFFFKHAGDIEGDAKQAVTRLSGLLSSQQVVVMQRQRLEVERFQRVVTLVGAAVLVPGLVAAVFGANVGFHGRDRPGAFWAMLVFMAAGGVGSYALLRSIELGVWADVAQRWPLRTLRPRMWPLTLGALAVGLAIAGLVVLCQS